MSTASFGKDGSVTWAGLRSAEPMTSINSQTFPLDRMMSGHYEKLTEDEWSSLYARGWLLTHYLTFEPGGKGQIDRYLSDFAAGKDGLQSAQQAFGDFKLLDRDFAGHVKAKPSAIQVAAPCSRLATSNRSPPPAARSCRFARA